MSKAWDEAFYAAVGADDPALEKTLRRDNGDEERGGTSAWEGIVDIAKTGLSSALTRPAPVVNRTVTSGPSTTLIVGGVAALAVVAALAMKR